jgi:hypothetical protein
MPRRGGLRIIGDEAGSRSLKAVCGRAQKYWLSLTSPSRRETRIVLDSDAVHRSSRPSVPHGATRLLAPAMAVDRAHRFSVIRCRQLCSMAHRGNEGRGAPPGEHCNGSSHESGDSSDRCCKGGTRQFRMRPQCQATHQNSTTAQRCRRSHCASHGGSCHVQSLYLGHWPFGRPCERRR